MTINSPSLTWTCLFAPDAEYQCSTDHAATKPWLRELITAQAGRRVSPRRAAQVITDGRMRGVFEVAGLPAIVAVNNSSLSDPMLRDAGFAYVRRFAVIPDLARARFFIPLDSPRVAAGGFSLWSPSRRLARGKYQLARAVARTGSRWWYRDHICIAQREAPPLEKTLASLFPGEQIRLALSSGSPPPTRNRKITLAILGGRGQVLGFGKMPGPLPLARERVEHEAAVLSHLNERSRQPVAPKLLHAGEVGDNFIAVTEPLSGRQPGAQWTDAHRRFTERLAGIARPLLQTRYVQSIQRRADLFGYRLELHAAMSHVMSRLGRLVLPASVVHGDFAPWNVRQADGELQAFDWESASLDGPPLVDQIHHRLATGYLLEKWSARQALDWLSSFAQSAPMGLPMKSVEAIAGAYLLDYLLRLFEEGYDDQYPRVAWCKELVCRLTAASAAEQPA